MTDQTPERTTLRGERTRSVASQSPGRRQRTLRGWHEQRARAAPRRESAVTTKKMPQSMKTSQQAILLVAICAATACGGKVGAVDDGTGATGSGVVGGNGSVGGTVSIGGAGGAMPVSTGGTKATGGTTSNIAPNSSRTVIFSNGKAVGAMTGYGNVYVGTTDTVSSPTCGASQASITSVAYCATSGTAIPFTSFNTACWNIPPNGTALTAVDVPNIDQIFVQVSAGPAAITVTNLCVTGITFS